MQEIVLVLKKKLTVDLPEKGLTNADNILPILLSHIDVMPRAEAENNFDYKQLVAYCIIRYENDILRYKRADTSSEHRLHNLHSIGWGGHVNNQDYVISISEDSIIRQAVSREIKEEIDIIYNNEPKLIGLINDDTNEVGKVHLGIVYEYILKSKEFKRKNKQGQKNIEFISIDELASNITQYEGWSQILISDYLSL